MGIKIFEDRKASVMFFQLSKALEDDKEKQKLFSREVKVLFDKKSVSREGEYKSFMITVEDLIVLGEKFSKSNL